MSSLIILLASVHTLLRAYFLLDFLTNASPGSGGDFLLGTTRQLDLRLLAVLGVADNDAGGTRSTRNGAAVGQLVLDVADDGTLGHLADGQDVADGQLGLVPAVEELTGANPLDGNHQLLVQPVAVRIAEHDAGEGSSATCLFFLLCFQCVVVFRREIVKASTDNGERDNVEI